MFRDLFENASLLWLPIAAMLLFLAMFLGVLVRVSRRGRRAQYEHMAHLPLEEDTGRRIDR